MHLLIHLFPYLIINVYLPVCLVLLFAYLLHYLFIHGLLLLLFIDYYLPIHCFICFLICVRVQGLFH